MVRSEMERARKWLRVRSLKLLSGLARSRGLDRAVRGVPALVMSAGLAMIALGLYMEVGQFNQGLARLADLSGPDGVAPAAAGYIQHQALSLLGIGVPVSGGDGGDTNPNPVVRFTPTLDIPADPGLGFIPYRVAKGSHDVAPQLATPTAHAHTATPKARATARPSPTPLPPAPPDRIVIAAINLDAPVVVAPAQTVYVGGQAFQQWDAPNYFAAGWQEGSALLGEPGNTVINGHHNINGLVFANLRDLSQGDTIDVYSGKRVFHYAVSQVMKLKERDAPLAQREENASWIMPSEDERLTLVTCWPPASNTYRLIVVAVPITGD